FARLECWGSFSNSSLRQAFRRACRKAGVTGMRPYDLRHSFGTMLYKLTGDIHAVGALMVHASQKTTARYTLAAVPQRLRLAVGKFNRAVPTASLKRTEKAGSQGWQSSRRSKKTA